MAQSKNFSAKSASVIGKNAKKEFSVFGECVRMVRRIFDAYSIDPDSLDQETAAACYNQQAKNDMREKVITAVMSIAIVVIGMLIAFLEAFILVGQGASADEAMVISLYSGFLLWVILAATVIVPAILNKLIK